MHVYLTRPLIWKAKTVDSIWQPCKVCTLLGYSLTITVHYVQKKRPKCFCNISCKTWAMPTKCGTPFRE